MRGASARRIASGSPPNRVRGSGFGVVQSLTGETLIFSPSGCIVAPVARTAAMIASAPSEERPIVAKGAITPPITPFTP